MFNWAKQQYSPRVPLSLQHRLTNIAGTQDPIYGPSATKMVAEEAKETPYTELTRDHLKWRTMQSTSVESQIFYLISDSGYIAFVQVMYGNVAGTHTTRSFNSKIFYIDGSKPYPLSSTPLNNYNFNKDKTNLYAEDCAVELSEDRSFYTIKSIDGKNLIVNIKITRTAPGFAVGKTGTTIYGTDLSSPWGSMNHAFWPRLYSFVLQGMEPHDVAAKWAFVNLQTPSYSAILMQFITPPSCGSTVVNVGGLAKDGEILTAGITNIAAFTGATTDTENGWPEPEEVRFTWSGINKDSEPVEAVLKGTLENR